MLLVSLALAGPSTLCHREHAEVLARTWSELPEVQRQGLASFAPLAARTTPADPDTCIPARAAQELATEHFVVEWDDGGVIDATRAGEVADALELSWERLFVDLGWALPEGTGTYAIRVWLTDDDFEGGFTTEVGCDGLALPVITIGAGTFDWGTWYQDVAAHELHHASHYRYGRAFDNWWWEATAIWIQESVFPANDEWPYYVDFFVGNPQWSLYTTSYDGDMARHMYGGALWVFWLEQEHGGHDFVRTLWERSAELPGNQDAAMPDVLAPDVDMDESFVAFAHQMAVRGIGEGGLYDLPLHTEVGGLPAEGGPIANERPEPWGMHFTRFHGDALPAEGLLVEVAAEDDTLDVALLGVRDGAVAEVVRGEPLLLSDADTFDEAWLVAVALGGDDRHTFDWAASASGDDGPATDSGGEDTDGDAVDPSGDAEAKGCGCTQAAPSDWLGPLQWLRRRRAGPT